MSTSRKSCLGSSAKVKSQRTLLTGVKAMGEATIKAGCRFFCAYPITPQTGLLEYLAVRMPEAGGVFIQSESELAAIRSMLS